MEFLPLLVTIVGASTVLGQEVATESYLDVYVPNKQWSSSVDIYQGPVVVLAETTDQEDGGLVAYYADNGIRSIVDYQNFQPLYKLLLSFQYLSGLVLSFQGLAGNDFLQYAVRDFVLPEKFKLFDLLRDNAYTVPVVYVSPKEVFKNHHFVGLYQVAKFAVKDHSIDAVPFNVFNYNSSSFYPNGFQPTSNYPFSFQPTNNYPFSFQPTNNYPFNSQSSSYPYNSFSPYYYPYNSYYPSYYPYNSYSPNYYPFNSQSSSYPYNPFSPNYYPFNSQSSSYPYNPYSPNYYPFNYQSSSYSPFGTVADGFYPFNYNYQSYKYPSNFNNFLSTNNAQVQGRNMRYFGKSISL